jgi:rubrerythrin
MFEQLKRVVGRKRRGDSVRECRRCGTTVERADGGCPACESTDIVQYDF